MKRVGLLGGSFNPVHIGHTMLASYMAQFTDLDEVWLVVSPLNPIKLHPEHLIDDSLRLRMLELAIGNDPRLKACDVELSMPRPSFSIDTLTLLSQRHPDCRFKWIMGSDNWHVISQWKAADTIISDYGVIIYPRPGYDVDASGLPDGVELVNAPTIDISSSFIRKSILSHHDMNFFLPCGVYEFITNNRLYQTTV